MSHDASDNRPALDRLPYPVARYAESLLQSWDDPNAEPVLLATRTLNGFELIVRYLGLVLLADTWPRGLILEERKRTVLGYLYHSPLGNLVSLLHELAAARFRGPPGFGHRLANHFVTAKSARSPNLKVTKLLKGCEPVKALRNKYAHGFASAPDRAPNEMRDEFQPAYDLAVAMLEVIAELPRVVRVLPDGRVEDWTGLGAPAGPQAAAVPAEHAGRCVMLPADGSAPVSLHPLVVYVSGLDRRDRLHFYDTVEVNSKANRATVVLRSFETGQTVDAMPALGGALERFFGTTPLADLFKRQRWAEELLGLEAIQKAGALIERHAAIVGTFRLRLGEEIAQFVAQNDSGMVVIQGLPGMGKTALVAYLIERQFADFRAPPPACFFFRRQEGMTSPTLCHQTLYSQLISFHEGAENSADGTKTSPEEVYIKLTNLLAEKIPKLLPEGRKQVVLIDALDEADRPAGASGDMAIFRRLPARLPKGVFLIVSTRPVSDVNWFATREGILRIDLNDPTHAAAHESDGLTYIDQHLNDLKLDPHTAARLSRFAAGNFLLLDFVRKHVASARLSAAGVVSLLDRFEGQDRSDLMADVYDEFWQRMKVRLSEQRARAVTEVAGVLAAALSPVPRGFLHAVLGGDPGLVNDALAELQEYLGSDRQGMYPPPAPSVEPGQMDRLRARPAEAGDVKVEEVFHRIFHKSFADFIKEKVYFGAAGHERLGRYCRTWAEHPDGFARHYALRYGPAHLNRAGMFDELAKLCSDIDFLAAKAGDGLVFELCQDLERAVDAIPPAAGRREELALLLEALLADVHFLYRHPTAVRQCLQARAWWYDAPDAAPHFAPAPADPPWGRPRLAPLLDGSPPAPPWVKSLRPPVVHLRGPQRMVIRGHGDGLEAVAVFAHPERGAVLASAGGNSGTDTAVRLWDADSGLLLKTFRGHTKLVHRVRFSPDGRWLLTSSKDQTVRLWDTTEQLPVREFLGHTGNVDCVAFSPCGRRAVSGARDGRVFLWELRSDAPPIELHRGNAQARGVAFHPSGSTVAAGFTDGVIRLWELGDSVQCREIKAHEDVIYSVAFSPDGAQLASGSRDRAVYLWDWRTGDLVAHLSGHEHWVYTVAFAPDGKRLLSASRDETVRVWCVDDTVPLFGNREQLFRGHEGAVYSAAFRARGGNELEVISGGADGTVRVWRLNDLLRQRPLCDHAATVRCIAFTPDGARVLTGAGHLSLPDHHTVRVWDADRGVPVGAEFRGHTDAVLAVAGATGAARVASGSRDRTARVWEPGSGAARWVLEHEAPVRAVALTADGDHLATGAMTGRVRVWNLASGGPVLRHTFANHERMVPALAFHPKGTHLLSGGFDGAVWLWDLATGSGTRVGEGLRLVTEVAFAADGGRFGCLSLPPPAALAAEGDRHAGEPVVHLWGLTNGRALRRQDFVGYTDLVGAVGGAAVLARVDASASELALTKNSGGRPPVAWFPETPEVLATRPGGGAWAGAKGGHLTLMKYCDT